MRDTPRPRSFLEVERAARSVFRLGLALDLDMQAELTAVFLEPLTSAKVMVSSSPYKVPSDLSQALCKAP